MTVDVAFCQHPELRAHATKFRDALSARSARAPARAMEKAERLAGKPRGSLRADGHGATVVSNARIVERKDKDTQHAVEDPFQQRTDTCPDKVMQCNALAEWLCF